MRRRLLTKKNSSWSTFDELNDANLLGDKDTLLDNLAIQSALKADQQNRRKTFCEGQLVDRLFKTELKKLPQVTAPKGCAASSHKKKLEPCRYNLKDELTTKQPKNLRTYSLPTTEASWNASSTLLSHESQQTAYHNNRTRLQQLCQMQKQSFQSTYGSTSFHPSEIQSGVISNETATKAKLTANQYVAMQWQPIRNYEFAKLTRKDILPLPHNYTRAKSKRLERRMDKTIKKHLHAQYQISHLFPTPQLQ